VRGALGSIITLSNPAGGFALNGNLTSDGTTSYGYDALDRLTSAGSAAFAYDPAGWLRETVGGGSTTRFVYDGVDLVAPKKNPASSQLDESLVGAVMERAGFSRVS
jgi:hypothetical protein